MCCHFVLVPLTTAAAAAAAIGPYAVRGMANKAEKKRYSLNIFALAAQDRQMQHKLKPRPSDHRNFTTFTVDVKETNNFK